MTLKQLIESLTGGFTRDKQSSMKELLDYDVEVHVPDTWPPMIIEAIYAVDDDRTINIDVGRKSNGQL